MRKSRIWIGNGGAPGSAAEAADAPEVEGAPVVR